MENIYILNEKQAPVGLLNPELPSGCPVFSEIFREQLEYGYFEYELIVSAEHSTASLLNEECFLVYVDNEGIPRLLKIKETEENNNEGNYTKKVFAESAHVSELTTNVVRPVKLASYTLQQAISYVLSGTGWELDVCEYVGTRDFEFTDYKTSLEALHEVLSSFGAEITFKCEFTGMTVTNRKVDVIRQKGSDTGVIFEYSRNVSEISRQTVSRPLYTALIGVGKGDSDTKPLTLAGYTPVGMDTTKYEKATNNDYIGSIEAFQRYAYNGKHLLGIFKDDKATNVTELFNNTLKKLNEISKPQYTYTVKIIDLSWLPGFESLKVQIGDTIVVKDYTYEPELILNARVLEIERSKISPEEDNITLGEFISISTIPLSKLQNIESDLIKHKQSWDTARAGMGTGSHVIAHSPKPLIDGEYFNDNHAIYINVTENTHLASVTIYCSTATSGVIELRDNAGKILLSKSITGLVNGANIIKLGWLLESAVGNYQLYGDFDGATYRTNITQFPYTSGSFSVTGTSSASNYWYHFYDIKIGGAFVQGGYGGSLRIGDDSNRLGAFEALNPDGETIMKVDKDQVTMAKAVIGELVAPNIPTQSTFSSITYFVDARETNGVSNGSDDYDGLTTLTPFRSLAKAISMIPRLLDGDVTIMLLSDIEENFKLAGYIGNGKIVLNLNTSKLTGTIRLDACKVRVDIADGTIEVGEGETRAPIQAYRTDYMYLVSCTIRGKTGTGGTSFVVNSQDSSFIYVDNCNLYNANIAICYAAYNGVIQLDTVRGNNGGTTAASMRAAYSGRIGVKSNTYYPAGSFQAIEGGLILGVSAPVSGVGSICAPTTTGTADTVTTPSNPTTPSFSITRNSGSGDTYRPNYSAWRGDGTVRQGFYSSYGNNFGYWFFPADLSTTVTGKTISKIEVTLTRLGTSGDGTGTFTIWAHGYTSKPGGIPTRLAGVSYTASFTRGQTRTITLPSSFHTLFSNGSAKGIGLYTSSTSSTQYGSFDDSATIKITYK